MPAERVRPTRRARGCEGSEGSNKREAPARCRRPPPKRTPKPTRAARQNNEPSLLRSSGVTRRARLGQETRTHSYFTLSHRARQPPDSLLYVRFVQVREAHANAPPARGDRFGVCFARHAPAPPPQGRDPLFFRFERERVDVAPFGELDPREDPPEGVFRMRNLVAAVSFETASVKTAAADASPRPQRVQPTFLVAGRTTDVATAAASGDTQPPLERSRGRARANHTRARLDPTEAHARCQYLAERPERHDARIVVVVGFEETRFQEAVLRRRRARIVGTIVRRRRSRPVISLSLPLFL